MQQMMSRSDDEPGIPPSQARWHFDRTINITVLLGFLGMIASGLGVTSYGVWFAAHTDDRITHLEQAETLRAPQADRLTRLEVQVQQLQQTVTGGLDDIKRLLRMPPEQRR